MTFLQLVQELVRLGGMSGVGGPPVISGQTGEYRRAIEFVKLAYEDVCNLHADWDFLWATGLITTEADLAVYPAPSDLGIWDEQRIHLDGEPLDVIPWAEYCPETLDPARPHTAVTRPDGQLQLVPEPDKAYTLTFDYFKAAPALASDGDEPLMPERFRRVILGRALILYGNYEAAQDVIMQGNEIYRVYMEMLERHQLSRRQQTHGRIEARPITVTAE